LFILSPQEIEIISQSLASKALSKHRYNYSMNTVYDKLDSYHDDQLKTYILGFRKIIIDSNININVTANKIEHNIDWKHAGELYLKLANYLKAIPKGSVFSRTTRRMRAEFVRSMLQALNLWMFNQTQALYEKLLTDLIVKDNQDSYCILDIANNELSQFIKQQELDNQHAASNTVNQQNTIKSDNQLVIIDGKFEEKIVNLNFDENQSDDYYADSLENEWQLIDDINAASFNNKQVSPFFSSKKNQGKRQIYQDKSLNENTQVTEFLCMEYTITG
jgi:hypothetical protein